MSREPLVLDLSFLTSAGLGRVLVDLEAAQLKAVRRNRSTGLPLRDEVVSFLERVTRLVEQEAESRDRAVRDAERGSA